MNSNRLSSQEEFDPIKKGSRFSVMELRSWRVRKKGEEFDPIKVYGGNPTVFSLKFNHGGFFSSLPGRKYKMGHVSFVDLVDSDEFSLHDVTDMINEMGYSRSWVVKTYVNDHICLKTRHVSLCTVSYLAKEIEQTIAFNPSIPIKALQEQIQQKKQIEVSIQKISKAKTMASNKLEGRSTSDILLNNLCEVFNRQLTGGRDKPIITCLEYIREYLMKRIAGVHKLIAKCEGPLTPNATKILEGIKSEANNYLVSWNGANKFQVSGPRGNQCVVDVDLKTCSCRKWELTGIPCRHAVAVNWEMARYRLEVGIPETWVSEVYWLDTWKKVYAHTIDPINGRDMWPQSACPTTLVPPKHHKQVGRPKKARKKSKDEQVVEKNGKMSRRGNSVRCTNCNNRGHNKRSCKGQGSASQQPPAG
ncbi:hypothetical protein SSX86_002838 [Deinandra increscens subsp. villosa]|uniref:SWIM-type domain-containing protein n=1 Tax=Deinandra increscens subsp. villosa TaxID=3103831 RepID=A0AAP0HDL3_9ASTR